MVLYFTGTGNSRYLARRIAEGLEMPLYDLNACIKAGDTAPVQTGRDVVQCGKIQPAACSTKAAAVHGHSPDHHAGKLHCHVQCTPKRAGPEHRGAGRACTSESAGAAQSRAGISCTERQPLRPLYERPGKPGVLSLLCKSGGLPGNGRLHRLRQVRGAVPAEQHPSGKRSAGLGQKLHSLHGLHLLLPQRSHRVRQKEQRQAPVSL